MPPPPVSLAPNELALYFETEDVIPARVVGALLREIDRRARLQRNFGREAVVQVLEIRSGSPLWIKLGVIGTLMAGAGALASGVADLGTFALELHDEFKSTSALGRAAGEAAIDNGVVSIQVITGETVFVVQSEEMSAIPLIQYRRARPETPRTYLPVIGEPKERSLKAPKTAGETSLLGSKSLITKQAGSTFDDNRHHVFQVETDFSKSEYLSIFGHKTVNLAGKFDATDLTYGFVSMSGRRYRLSNDPPPVDLPTDRPVAITAETHAMEEAQIELRAWRLLDDL